jgi:fibronectin-binding autotransporter adhesin
LNFVGKFDAKLPADGSVAHSHVHVEHPSAHAPADAIIVPDAHLLFGADFKRSGVDLILSNADRELVVHDYFKGEHRHPLASPDGAHLTGDIVNALTGQVEVAQADGSAAVAHVIGHVTKLTGSATAIRNGVSVILNNGDNVEKGDVVATGSDSTLGVTFIDGTVFGLSSNARMVLNEMVYDPNGSNNSSLISLVAGTISFVAGETAKHGDMKVDTPVATMGIRGTAVLVEIDFSVPSQNGLPDAKFQVLVEPDGTTGSYILFDKTTLDPIATVNRAGQQVNINQNGISYTNSPLTPELQKLITDVFTQKFSNTDTNTKTLDHFTDSIVPLPFQTFKGPDNIVIQTVFLQTNSLGNGPSQNQGPSSNKGHVDVAPTVGATSGASAELPGVTGSTNTDTATGFITFQDVNLGDQPTASAAFHSFSYQDAQHHDISLKLTPTEQAAVQAVEVALNITQDPLAQANGTALWSYNVSDAALDFLGENETLTLTYLVTVSNNFAQSIKTTTVPITITITGTNDVPVITSAAPQTIAFNGGTNVPGGDLIAHVATSGTITFDDPDLTDTHTVSVAVPTSTLTDPVTHVTTPFTLPPNPLALFNQALTASITDPSTGLPTDSTGTGVGTVSWSLAALPVWLGDFIPQGEILTLTYAVTVTDSQGATSTQDITITITGTAAPAEVWIATTGTGPALDGLWSTGVNWETGIAPTATSDAIIITNQLEGLTPTYPVTITSAVGVNGAAANSLTMDNFGGSAPLLINQVMLAIGTTFDINDHSTDNPVGYTGPEFDNQATGTVTIGGAFNLNADAVVHNAGSLTVTGKMEALDQSTVQNSGTIKLAGGGDFSGQSTISNTVAGALIEVTGGLLNVSVDISNLGTVKIDPSAALTLSSATIGGTVTNNGTLTLNGSAVVKNGTLGNSGQINVSGSSNALDNEQVTNTGGIEILALGALTLDLLTTVANAGHIITVDGSADDGVGTLTLQGGSSITGGSLANSGTVDIEGTSITLDGVAVTGSGAVNIDEAAASTTTLVLKDTTSITNGTLMVGPTGVLSVAGSATFDHVGVTNQNSIEITAGNVLTLDGLTTVDNTSGTLTVDGSGKLTLNDASIDGGTINDFSTDALGHDIAGTIDVTGSSTISNADLNHGNVTVESGRQLTLDGDTVTGTAFTNIATGVIHVDGKDTLSLDDVTVSGGGFTIGAGALVTSSGDVTLTSTAVTNDGTIEITGGTLKISGSVDSSVGQSGSIQIDAGAGLDLAGSDTQNIVFSGAGGELKIETPGFAGSISGLGATDTIDLSTIGYGPDTTGTYKGGVLTITDGVHSISMTLVGDYSNAHFAGSADANGDTLITLNANDDAPIIATADKAETASVTERANTTDSAASDPLPAASGTIHFTDVDLTDRPTADVTLNVTWTDGTTDLSSTLTPTEISALESAFVLTQSGNTNNGALGWTYQISDSALDFLGAGETATVTAAITLLDHQGGTDTATVTVDISGSNDAPALAADTSGSNGAGLHAIAERAGETGDTADTDSASGTLSFTDVDLTDTHMVAKGAPTYIWSGGSLTTGQADALTSAATLALTETDSTHTGAGSVGFTYSAADSTFDFLAAGETLTVTYEITVTDKSGISSSQPVSFTVTGSNDAPVLAADTSGNSGTGLHAIAERAGETGDIADTDSASGTLSFTDVDLTDTHTVTKSAPTYVWSGGNLTTAQTNALTSAATLALTETDSTHTGAGSVGVTYSAADSTFDFLAAGQTLTVTYDIAVTDTSGASSSEPVTFTVTGSNDAPTIVGETNPAIQTIILAQSPFVLSAGTSTNSLGLSTETFDEAGITAGSASNNGSGHGTFTNSALGAHFSSSGNAGVVHGSSSVTAAPFIGPLPGHADTTNYLSIGANGSETITFTAEQNKFGLYWGSVDTFNTISFFNGSQLVASYSGADVAPLLANGNQGSFSASGYVEFSDLAPFTKVVLASGSSNAFEIDNISAGFVSDSHVHLAGPITGTIIVNDADIGDTLTASVIGNAVAEYNGSTTLPSGVDISALIASGAIKFDTVTTTGGQDVLDWTYNPTNPNLDFLEPGDKLTLTFNATVSDGHATTANQALTITLVGNGSSVVNGTAQNDTFADVGGGVTISGNGGHDIYDFNAHFHGATITDFDVSNDVIDISSTLFTSVTALLNSAVGSGANTIITDSAGDNITLDHVSVAQLKANPGDFQFTIANGGAFEAGASTSENAVFEGSTGKLTIDTPSSFNGVISGFTGDGTLSGSDQIDLKGIDYNSSHFTESFDAANDTLSVSDGTNSALLHFNGTYQAANFKFTTDNGGGTIVYDPPVSANAASDTSVNTPAVSNNGHGFVFNFAGDGHDVTGNHPAGDTHLFDSRMVTDAEAALNRLHDDSHVVPPVIDSHDPSAAAAKAQWHASDFHFV